MNNYILSVFGKKGSGKTFFVEWWSLGMQRCIIYDTMRQFNRNSFIITTMDDFINFIELVKKNKIFSFRISLQFKDYKEMFSSVNEILVNNLKNFTYIVDEIHNYMHVNSSDKYYDEMIVEGRHLKINLITISHRPAGLPLSLLMNADYLAIFETGLKRDKEFFSNYKYFNPEYLQNLKDFEFIFLNSKNKKCSIEKIKT